MIDKNCPNCKHPIELWVENFKGSNTQILRVTHFESGSNHCFTEDTQLSPKVGSITDPQTEQTKP